MPNENTTPAADEKPAFHINSEADIITWLRARAAQTDIPGLVIGICSESGSAYPIHVKVKDDNHAFGCGDSIEASIKMIRQSYRTPEQRAEKKRAEAAKLLAEADALAPAAMPAREAAAA